MKKDLKKMRVEIKEGLNLRSTGGTVSVQELTVGEWLSCGGGTV